MQDIIRSRVYLDISTEYRSSVLSIQQVDYRLTDVPIDGNNPHPNAWLSIFPLPLSLMLNCPCRRTQHRPETANGIPYNKRRTRTSAERTNETDAPDD